jgi:hypothetical protein
MGIETSVNLPFIPYDKKVDFCCTTKECVHLKNTTPTRDLQTFPLKMNTLHILTSFKHPTGDNQGFIWISQFVN